MSSSLLASKYAIIFCFFTIITDGAYFTFLYRGTTYKLKDDKLEIISEDDI